MRAVEVLGGRPRGALPPSPRGVCVKGRSFDAGAAPSPAPPAPAARPGSPPRRPGPPRRPPPAGLRPPSPPWSMSRSLRYHPPPQRPPSPSQPRPRPRPAGCETKSTQDAPDAKDEGAGRPATRACSENVRRRSRPAAAPPQHASSSMRCAGPAGRE